ncbi:Unknown protein [Striga hermonthica]|uniref:Uncharacterized protein n=1 Tax=Striga hermonthica TaxID=68872 RepID=A0A9N7RTG6_STRHE|nr:Unknown protein [Striga hermonthica]
MAKNNKSGSRSKHIDIKYLAVRERMKEEKVVIEHISTELMIADPLTKGMPPKNFKDHVVRMGLGSRPNPVQVCDGSTLHTDQTRLDSLKVLIIGFCVFSLASVRFGF